MPEPPQGDGWWYVGVALAVPTGLEIAKRLVDYLLPPGRHLPAIDRFTRRDDADEDDDEEADSHPPGRHHRAGGPNRPPPLG